MMRFKPLSVVTLFILVAGEGSQTTQAQQIRPFPKRDVTISSTTSSTEQVRIPGLYSLGTVRNASDKVRQTLKNSNERHSLPSQAVDQTRPQTSTNTIPFWSDSFTYQGLEYTYKMVGSDPSTGSRTTIIPTIIIPLRFVFSDGNVFDASTDLVDGRTPIQGIINSPIFQNYNFVIGGTAVGNTQYGDAFQRANFWDSVSTRAPNYHVLLGQPTVLPSQTIVVPAGFSSYTQDPETGQTIPVVDEAFLESQTNPILLAANVSSNSLPIIVWGSVESEFALAFHGITNIGGSSAQTFIATTYSNRTMSHDVYPLSHEIVEWMDDPFEDSFTPGWLIPYIEPIDRCDSSFTFHRVRDLLETADPVEFFAESRISLPGPAYTYHVTDAMFVDYYTRSSRSRSVNGQYDMFDIGAPYGLPSEPSLPCTGHVEFKPTFIEFPGASFTAVTGVNSLGAATGFYNDSFGQHGFVLAGSRFTTIDFPGAVVTDPSKINDSGMVVGSFMDSSGAIHGFSYSGGAWIQIDFPGSLDTEVNGVNSAGDMVGVYDAFQPITHGFLLHGGKFQTIDTPFGIQSAATGINELGVLTGLGWTDPFNGPYTAFILKNDKFTEFNFPLASFTEPLSINNANELAGLFVDPDGTAWGMVTVKGYPHQVFAGVWGSDDQNRIYGYTYDFVDGRFKGFIGELPLARNVH